MKKQERVRRDYTRNTQRSDDIVRTISKDIEPNRNDLAIPSKLKVNKGWFKKGVKPRSDKKESQRIETRRKNGWWRNPKLTKGKIGDSNSIALKNYYKKGNNVWNKNLTKKDPRVLAYSSKTSGILKNKVKYKDSIEGIRQYQITHPNRKFSLTDIEILIRDGLISRGLKQNINFIGQVPVKGRNGKKICRSDWYLIKDDLHIFCDGCYYHNCHKCKKYKKIKMEKKDKRNNEDMTRSNINFIRFWGHDIHSRLEWCLDQLGI